MAISCLITHPSRAQEDLRLLNYWQYHDRADDLLYDRFCQVAFDQLQKRQARVSQLDSRDSWLAYQAEIRQKLSKAVGPFPPKTPLRPVVVEIMDHPDMTVEKLYYQSQPGFFVTAALFLPKKRAKPLPAILYCSGHTREGFRSPTYQHVILNYVAKGFAVLAFDPVGQGERYQYLDDTGQPYLGPTHEHSYPGSQCFLTDRTMASHMIWDGIRSIDYLLSRPEVDPERIGVTGRSGGGTQSSYIAAFDDRVAATAPENYLTSFDKLLRSQGPQDAEQNFLHSIALGLDHADLVLARAPKPTLILTTSRDMFSIQGSRDMYAECRRAYAALGQGENLQLAQDDAPHRSTPKNREAAYAFFQQHLANPGSPDDLPIGTFPAMDLQVTPTGQVATSLNSLGVFELNRTHAQKVTNDRTPPKDLPSLIRHWAGIDLPTKVGETIYSGTTWRDDYAIDRFLVRAGHGDYFLPVLWLRPDSSKGVFLYLPADGKEEGCQMGGMADQLARAGHEVVLVDLPGFGELAPERKSGDAVIQGISYNRWYAGVLTGQSMVGAWVEDIHRLARFIREQKGPSTEMDMITTGPLGAAGLHACVLDLAVRRFVSIGSLSSYQSIVDHRDYLPQYIMESVPGCLPYYDLPDLIQALPRVQITLYDPVDATGQSVTPADYLAQHPNLADRRHLSVFAQREAGQIVSQLVDDRP